MPFKSEAQKRKFGELLKDGKINQKDFDHWVKETGDRKLPERLKDKTSLQKKPNVRKRWKAK